MSMELLFLLSLSLAFFVNLKVTQWGMLIDSPGGMLEVPLMFRQRQGTYYLFNYLLWSAPLIISFFLEDNSILAFCSVILIWYLSSRLGARKAFHVFKGSVKWMIEYERKTEKNEERLKEYAEYEKMSMRDFIKNCKEYNDLKRRF